MKRSTFTDSQIMDALKRVDAGLAVPDVCRELGISSATFYKWRAKYGGMDASMMALLTKFDVLFLTLARRAWPLLRSTKITMACLWAVPISTSPSQ